MKSLFLILPLLLFVITPGSVNIIDVPALGGKAQVLDITPGTSSSYFSDITTYCGRLYFDDQSSKADGELWSYDEGTNLVEMASSYTYVENLGQPGYQEYLGSLYFSGDTGHVGYLNSYTCDNGLFSYQTSVNLANYLSSSPPPWKVGGFMVYNDRLYFRGYTHDTGFELYVFYNNFSSLVGEVQQGAATSNVDSLSVYNDELYFFAGDGNYGETYSLWKYSEPSGVVFVGNEWGQTTTSKLNRQVLPIEQPSGDQWLVPYNGQLFFSTLDIETGVGRLWKYDSVDDIFTNISVPEATRSTVLDGIVYDGKLYFNFATESVGGELFSYDSVTNLVSLAADIIPGEYGSWPTNFEVYNDQLYFSIADNIYGGELWRYDSRTDE
ncbi:MAG: hypothetical protein K8S00_05260, partial [Bacteroidales bacterium]|nr:hypothetical protein [Bacteroidales bacterium]